MPTKTQPMSRGLFIFNVIMTALFFPALILLLAGSWQWVEGWLFAAWVVVMILSNLFYQYLKNPDLLAERTNKSGSTNQKSWDRYMEILILVLAMAWFVLMPLDAERFGWSPTFPLWSKILGGILLIPALFLIYRATVDNTYLSRVVRIQEDRKQQVVSTGVYGFVRHPLYLGCVLMLIGAPLLLGSCVGSIISALGTITLVARIIGEEKMMVEELEGYREYQKKVKYRLIPFVW
jgi:protein-S-isoprenylcysteine O-methyltransferase Ste14